MRAPWKPLQGCRDIAARRECSRGGAAPIGKKKQLKGKKLIFLVKKHRVWLERGDYRERGRLEKEGGREQGGRERARERESSKKTFP